MTGDLRLAYPDNHIEADNRLSWLLGRLDKLYGDQAFYVHLYRDFEQTVESFIRRSDYGIMKAYREGVLLEGESGQTSRDFASDYIETVTQNIKLFLKDKTHTMDFTLESAADDFVRFWQLINASGDLEVALNEWNIAYNSSA